ncbi:MAG: DUF2188 domain-containing protein [Syntrophomonadaceae bacterium]
MSKQPIHTVPNSKGGWDNKRQGSNRALSHTDKKVDAVKLGRDQSIKDGTEHFIHNKNGQIAQRNSCGKDPYPPKG